MFTSSSLLSLLEYCSLYSRNGYSYAVIQIINIWTLNNFAYNCILQDYAMHSMERGVLTNGKTKGMLNERRILPEEENSKWFSNIRATINDDA